MFCSVLTAQVVFQISDKALLHFESREAMKEKGGREK